jgi:MFS family permease
MAAQVSSSTLMGWLGDRRGHLLAFQIGIFAAIISTTMAWLANGVAWFYPIFILAGMANVAAWTIPMAMTIEFSTQIDRPAYIGLANTLTAPSTFLAPIIGGSCIRTCGDLDASSPVHNGTRSPKNQTDPAIEDHQ